VPKKVNLFIIIKKLFKKQKFDINDIKRKDILDSLQMITLIEHLTKNYNFDSKDFNKKFKTLNIENLTLYLNKN
tara:strand:+ start:1137 stop:1358 length:222 start_codon:yes stop_codon:yes gene_type:complete